MATALMECPCCSFDRLAEHCPSKACDCYVCRRCGCGGTRDGRRRVKNPKCPRR